MTTINDKIAFVEKLELILQGKYDAFGIEKWFYRKRVALEGESPFSIISADWFEVDGYWAGKLIKLAKD